MNPTRYLSVRETSQKWGVSRQRVLIWIAEARVPAVRVGVQWTIPDTAVRPEAKPAGRRRA